MLLLYCLHIGSFPSQVIAAISKQFWFLRDNFLELNSKFHYRSFHWIGWWKKNSKHRMYAKVFCCHLNLKKSRQPGLLSFQKQKPSPGIWCLVFGFQSREDQMKRTYVSLKMIYLPVVVWIVIFQLEPVHTWCLEMMQILNLCLLWSMIL